jgi:hypothetical protein
LNGLRGLTKRMRRKRAFKMKCQIDRSSVTPLPSISSAGRLLT